MIDDEISHVLAGWAAVFLGGALALWATVTGLFFIALLCTLLIAGGILVLVYAFLQWRLPELINLIKDIKKKGVVSSIQSLGL